MSLSECDRFAADLQSNEALRAEAEKAHAAPSPENPLARMVALASSKGYSVTVEEAREHLKAKAAANGKVLSDAELDGVAGGGGVPGGGTYYTTPDGEQHYRPPGGVPKF